MAILPNYNFDTEQGIAMFFADLRDMYTFDDKDNLEKALLDLDEAITELEEEIADLRANHNE